MSLTGLERETVINMNDGEDLAEIYTYQKPLITSLKKNPSAILVEEGKFEGSAWARFEVPATLLTIRKGTKQISKEQKVRLAENAKRMRAARIK